MTECVQHVGSSIQSGASEQRVRALQAMASLVFLQVSLVLFDEYQEKLKK